MIRKAMIAMAVLAVATGPAYADAVFAPAHEQGQRPGLDGASHHQVRVQHERFERAEHFSHFAQPHGYGYAYAPQCYWEAAHWVKQVYPSPYGGYAYVPQYVPGQWVCY
jgi:hypothetical protein